MTQDDTLSPPRYSTIVLAAGRGPDDPMAQTFATGHKCLVEVAGQPMIMRVLNVLRNSPQVDRIAISIEDVDILKKAKGYSKLPTKRKVTTSQSGDTIAQSILQAIKDRKLRYPILITTADHALLTDEMISHFCSTSAYSGADVTVGVAHEDVIRGAYPNTRRTYFKFSDGRYSGCNLFALLNPDGLNAVHAWQKFQKDRKKPWRIMKTLGLGRLADYLKGALTLTDALTEASTLMNARIEAVRIPFAEAAIDVDTPEDLELAHSILMSREISPAIISLDLDARPEVEKPKRGKKPTRGNK